MIHHFIDQLIQQGALHFCISPGSRSTPLVNAVVNHPKAIYHVHFDERGLGFFALGLSQALNKPVVIICTSGTAVGNLLPSIMEAHHSYIPLIVLTADRPLELKMCGANQTTNQTHIFSPFVRLELEIGDSEKNPYLRSIAKESYFYAMKNSKGPVHINCSFKEPLHLQGLKYDEGKEFPIYFPTLSTKPFQTTVSKGLIIIGPLPSPSDLHPILDLAKRLQWPVIGDILSNARSFPSKEQIRNFDYIEKPKPELILHFGGKMTSKKLLEWIEMLNTEYVHISPYPELQDPTRSQTMKIQSDISSFCETFKANHDPDWFSKWGDIAPFFPKSCTFTEVDAMRYLSQILPKNFGVFLGNGMPIRDADHFLFPNNPTQFFANRGLSGIDGNIATVAGLAQKMPILAIIGDQTALHDLNSITLLKKTVHPVILLIFNNFGGGIFHHLKIKDSPHFETLWAAKHELSFHKIAEMFDISYLDFSKINETLTQNKSAIIELITDRHENHRTQPQSHKSIMLKVDICQF